MQLFSIRLVLVLALGGHAPLLAGAGAVAASEPFAGPPAAAAAVTPRLREPTPPPAIFTYSLDRSCQVTGIRKLQGSERVRWQDVESARQISREELVFRFVDGRRTRLQERRVQLLGELVANGELVCQLRPSGEVVNAWIERHDSSAARRLASRREPVPVVDGGIVDLGTYSLVFAPVAAEPTAGEP